ncbi:DUF6445 family protein [Asticcacaulis sp. 201]|uniref:DUF6445 family protein n=1 Tax=Asticcacaulis sp. 201 TaxID=3028787 RepID=UPI00291663D0|nr:DUF6445 family protein [Asticcacaulis sp. 201]MDV6330235.1 DUF6445 family protein [Asticcacaulis sp. 201]
MKPQLLTFGQDDSRVVVIDGFSQMTGHIRTLAAALAPFPPATTYYPGVRRLITPDDTAAYAYAERLLEDAAPFIGGTFDVDAFDWLETSFSMVTRTAAELTPRQRAPHFDDTDPNHLAVLHYLSPTPGSGTAFFRHRATGIERVTEDNMPILLDAMKREHAEAPQSGYILGSNPFFEQIGQVDAVPDRVTIYQGSLLHSGIIPPDMVLSDDPMTGRLTANLFVRGRAA